MKEIKVHFSYGTHCQERERISINPKLKLLLFSLSHPISFAENSFSLPLPLTIFSYKKILGGDG
jgi:hypothetical protein